MSECPRGGGKAFQLSEWFSLGWSGETAELAKCVVAIERVPRGQGGARGRQLSWEDVQRRSQVPTPTPTHVVSRPGKNKVGSTPSQPQTTSGCSALCQHCRRHNMRGPQQSTLGDWMVVTKRKEKRQPATMVMLNPIVAIEPQSVNGVTEDDEWEEVKLALDGGATETVIPPDILEGVELRQGGPYKRGVEYEAANGVQIPNLGEREFTGVTAEGSMKSVVSQVCDVNRGLLSVRKIARSGNRVVFDNEGSYIENKTTGEVTRLQDDGGMYELTVWVKRKYFQRQGGLERIDIRISRSRQWQMSL